MHTRKKPHMVKTHHDVAGSHIPTGLQFLLSGAASARHSPPLSHITVLGENACLAMVSCSVLSYWLKM